MAYEGGVEFADETQAKLAIIPMKTHTPKYIVAFFLTLGIFAIAWIASDTLNKQKFTNLKTSQDKIAIDILSSETEFDLLKEGDCGSGATAVFSKELATLAEKIAYSEQNVATPDEIMTLKKQYTLLEIRDFLLNKRVAERCKQTFTSVFYFYGTELACADCTRQGYVLDALRDAHPEVRVYAFDYNLDLSTVKALIDIYNVGDALPAIVLNGTTLNGYQSLEQLSSLIPKQQLQPTAKTK